MWSQVVGSGGTSQWTTSGSSIYYNGGNVGIGVASPGNALTLAKATWPSLGFLKNGIGTWNLGTFTDSTNNFDIWLNAVAPFLSVTTAGSVGIGNTAPGLPLEVKAPHAGGPATTGATQTGIMRLSQGDGAAVFDMGINVTTGAGWLQSTVSTNLASVLPLLLNPNGGNVGIGTASPGQKLDVNGNINAAGSVTATAFFYSSDARLKKNVEAIASNQALQDILALQPVTYNWIDPTQPTTTQLGFIAQQVEQVVPELVTTNTNTTMKAVDYARVTPLLVGAAQAQQAQIDAQQKEIDALVAEVAALKAEK